MTVYVSTEAVKAELAKLAANIKGRRAAGEELSDLAIDLEFSFANYAIVLQADAGVMSMEPTLAAIDALIAKSKAGK